MLFVGEPHPNLIVVSWPDWERTLRVPSCRNRIRFDYREVSVKHSIESRKLEAPRWWQLESYNSSCRKHLGKESICAAKWKSNVIPSQTKRWSGRQHPWCSGQLASAIPDTIAIVGDDQNRSSRNHWKHVVSCAGMKQWRPWP